jgi:hypothetical protein
LVLQLCGDVPLDHFGVPRCSVTFTPLLKQVTYCCGKTLWVEAKKFSCGNVQGNCAWALGGGDIANFRPKKNNLFLELDTKNAGMPAFSCHFDN